jgi:PrtD family type I secretion system ABC transporter
MNAPEAEVTMKGSGPTPTARTALLYVRKAFLTTLFLSSFINFLMLTVPVYMMQSFDRVLPGRSLDTLWLLTMIAIFALGIFALLHGIRQRILTRAAVIIDEMLTPDVFRRSVHMASINRAQTIAAHARDVEPLRNFIGSNQIGAFFDVPWMPLFLLVMFLIHPALGVAAVVGAILLVALAVTNELVTRRHIERQRSAQRPLTEMASAATRNAEVVEAMGMLGPLLARWAAGRKDVHDAYLAAEDRGATVTALGRALRFVVQIAVMAIGLYYAIEREITPGSMIAASVLMGRALAPVDQMMGVWRGFVNARMAYRRLNTLLSMPLPARTTTDYPRPDGRLTVHNLGFIFSQGARPVLSGVSFDLPPGQILGVIGPSAAGKSTLARLIVGVWKPGAGSIRLDGIEVFGWGRENFGRWVGYLPQDVELFAGTVKENIARLREAPDEHVLAAAKQAHAHEMIVQLPDAYETMIGPDGHSLSGGQRQRVGLARALFGTPSLLVLDEPDAHLDRIGETALAEALDEARRHGTTIVVISHRPAILSITDRILVLRNGGTQMYGMREDVLAALQDQRTATEKQNG